MGVSGIGGTTPPPEDSSNEPAPEEFQEAMDAAQTTKPPNIQELEASVRQAIAIENTDISTANKVELNMLKYFKLPLNKENLYTIRNILKEMQMGAYRYMKRVFEKSRKQRKEEFREEGWR